MYKGYLISAEELQIPLEINGYGFRKEPIDTSVVHVLLIPCAILELAAEYNITVVVNSDAHTPREVGASLKEGLQMAHELGLQVADLRHLE